MFGDIFSYGTNSCSDTVMYVDSEKDITKSFCFTVIPFIDFRGRFPGETKKWLVMAGWFWWLMHNKEVIPKDPNKVLLLAEMGCILRFINQYWTFP